MAIWVNVNRVAFCPEVMAVYARAGRGQGTTQSSGATTPKRGAKGFMMTVKRAMSEGVIALPSWIRPSPGGGPGDWQNAQVDIQNIPGVRSLRKTNLKWANF